MFLITCSAPAAPSARSIKELALPVLLVEFIVIGLAVVERPKADWKLNAVWVSLAGLVAIAWVTAITAPQPVAGMIRTALWMIHLAFGISISHLARREPSLPEDMPKALMVGFLGLTLLFVIFAAIVNRPDYDWITNIPAYGNIRWFGYFAAVAIALSAPGVERGRKLAFVACTLAFAIAFWTGSRGALASTLIGIAGAALFFPTLRRFAFWGRFGAGFSFGLLLSLGLDAAFPIQGAARIVSEASGIMGGSGRVELWFATLQNIALRPWFGWGEGQVGFMSGRELGVGHPHNFILQVVHAWGLAGAALLILPAAWLARLVLRPPDPRALSLNCAVIVLAAFSMIDGTLFHVHSLAIFAACVGILGAQKNGEGRRDEAAA
ncbi:MAG: O-antigen ligase family protein [Sphingosinicella sp.]|nr:O-antigen ligase family protein [Sphingosinicella sp.]